MGFVTLMWTNAFFCGAQSAGVFGLWYCGFRLLFPVFWSMKGSWNVLIEISTQGGYTIVNYYIASMLYLVFTGNQLRAALASNSFLFILTLIGVHVAMNVVVM